MSSSSVFKIRISGLFKVDFLPMTWNNTLQEKLDEFCMKYALDSTEYTLVSLHKKNLDLTIPFRLTGLSPNAHLDIVPISEVKSNIKLPKSKPKVSKCSIAVQLPNGQRFKIEAQLKDTIWKVLKQVETESQINITRSKNGEIYLQPHVHLLNTTFSNMHDLKLSLRKVGLKKGDNALLRLSFSATRNFSEMEPILDEMDTFSHCPTDEIADLKDISSLEFDNGENTISNEEERSSVSQVNSIGDDTMVDETSESSHKNNEDENEHCIPIEHSNASHIKLFAIGSGKSESIDDIPDEEFEMKASELQALLLSIQEKQREREFVVSRPKKSRKYDSAVVRIRFPQGYLLQGTFPIDATVRDIYKMVQAVVNPYEESFYLYTAPPIVKYDNLDADIGNLNFAPAIILNISSKPKLTIRQEIADNYVQSLSTQPIPQNQNKEPEKPILPSKSNKLTSGTKTSSNKKSLPKWFQMGFKK